MKLRNKKTGEIINSKELLTDEFIIDLFSKDFNYFNSKLYKLQEYWEGYEEPKDIWWLDDEGNVNHATSEIDDDFEKNREIGNYFSSREEAKKAVEKLKAVKRLKDKGFRFTGWTIDDGLRISICSNIDEEDIYDEDKRKMKPDLDLLFGGEE